LAAALKSGSNYLTILAVAIFIGGLSIKGGLVPFHGWLPDAYSSAPAGASVLLAGIVTKTTGIYTIIRLVTTVFGFTPQIKAVLLFVGALSIVVGALAALGQKDFKRMLAYSSISQMGYIILSLGTGTPLGLAGAVFHMFNHAIFKTQLFVNAAAVEEQTGTRDMDVMGGLSARMPVTGTTSVVAFLSTAGIPPLSGFWSKLIIIVAVWVSGYHFYAMVAVLASVITCAYFLSMQRRVFFGPLVEEFKNIKEAKMGILVPEVVLALLTIGIGLLFPYVLNSFILPIKSIVG
jgi:multicomponent Na+:H+ antiporter subunit D